jgi:hypothetical protein
VLACAVHGDALEHLLGGVFILAVALLAGAGGWGLGAVSGCFAVGGGRFLTHPGSFVFGGAYLEVVYFLWGWRRFPQGRGVDFSRCVMLGAEFLFFAPGCGARLPPASRRIVAAPRR